MRNIKIVLIVIFSFVSSFFFAQEKQEILKPSEGKSLVYFIRPSAGAFLIEFKLFHQDKYLGKLKANRYLTYECDPGEQLFWASSENRDFVKANLEPNKVYVISVMPQFGAFVAGVNMVPLSPNDFQAKNDFNYIIKKNKGAAFTEESVKFSDEYESIVAGLEKYKKLRDSDSDKIRQLTADMNFVNADKPVKI